MAYAIRYFRDPETVRLYEAHGVHNKPVGYVIGHARYNTQMRALKDADHINSLGPAVPVTVVRVSG